MMYQPACDLPFELETERSSIPVLLTEPQAVHIVGVHPVEWCKERPGRVLTDTLACLWGLTDPGLRWGGEHSSSDDDGDEEESEWAVTHVKRDVLN